MAHQHSGPRSRIWMGTLWTEEDKETVKGIPHQYLIISDNDQTEEEQLHWHCMIQFKNARVRPRTVTAHWEIPNSKLEARNYCIQKGPNYFEDGTLMLCTKDKDEWNGFVDMCKKATPRELIDSPFSRMYANYMAFAGTVHNQFADLSIMDGNLENLWLWGAPGTGKTRWAWEHYPDLYVKDAGNKWWDGYHGQETVLLDDWDPRNEILTQKLKIWADRYPFRAECKGGSMMARPKRVIITSNYSIEACFTHPEDVEAIKRRFKVHHFLRLGDGPTLE